MLYPEGMVKWVAKLSCGHVVGDSTTTAPVEGGTLWCPEDQDGAAVQAVVTDEPVRSADGRAW